MNFDEIAEKVKRKEYLINLHKGRARILIWFPISCIAVVLSFLLISYIIRGNLRSMGGESLSLYIAAILIGTYFIALAFTLLSRQIAILSYKNMRRLTKNDELLKDKDGDFLEFVRSLAVGVDLNEVPEIWVYDSDDENVFSVGPDERHAMIVFSSILLESADEHSLAEITAYEIANIVTGNMMTESVIQAMSNFITMLLSAIVYLLAKLVLLPFGKRVEKDEIYAYKRIVEKCAHIICSVLLLPIELVKKIFAHRKKREAKKIASQLMGDKKQDKV